MYQKLYIVYVSFLQHQILPSYTESETHPQEGQSWENKKEMEPMFPFTLPEDGLTWGLIFVYYELALGPVE